MTENDKLKIFAEYAQGAKPREVEAKYDIPYSTALRLSNEFKKAQTEGTVEKLIDMDSAVLEQVRDHMMVPGELEEAKAESFASIENGTDGLGRLDVELQITASAVNKKILAMLTATKQPSELETLTHCLCRIREAFFKAGTQVNVQNNYGGGAYQEYLDDVPKN